MEIGQEWMYIVFYVSDDSRIACNELKQIPDGSLLMRLIEKTVPSD